jgi:selenide,water dikinase
MTTLNRAAADALRGLPPDVVHACTDVTGFGLIGHATEMAVASNCTLEIEARAVPLLPGVRQLVKGNVPGGGKTNLQHFGPTVRASGGVDPESMLILYDPQTSGGLLISISPEHTALAADTLKSAGVAAAGIGRVLEPSDARVTVR